MVAVVIAAAFFVGVRIGQRQPTIDGPGPRAMAFVKSIRISNDTEANAVFLVAELFETSRPGFLRSRPIVEAFTDEDQMNWQVTFIDPVTKQRLTGKVAAGGSSVEEFIRRRDRGFILIAH